MFPYILLFIIVVILAKLGQNNKASRILLFIVMTFFVGLRKDVGTDYESYANLYALQEDYLEVGFSYILLYLNQHGFSEAWFFWVMAAISYFFMYKAVESTPIFKRFPVLVMLPLLSLTFLCNGIRQGIAICIFLYSFHFIQERKPIAYWGCIAIAFLFHKSILLGIPFYFLKDRHLSRQMYFLIYIFSFVFCTINLNSLLGPIASLIETNKRYSVLMASDSGFGYLSLGVLLEMSNYILLILIATQKKIFKKYPLLFNMVFIAGILMNMRVGAPLMNRVLVMFVWFCYPLIPIVLDSVSGRNRQILKWYFILSYTIVTVKYIFFDDMSMMCPYHDALGIF